MRYVDRIERMRDGTIVAKGPIDEAMTSRGWCEPFQVDCLEMVKPDCGWVFPIPAPVHAP